MSEHLDKAELMRRRLDGVSPSFCLAKWLQVTIHLQNGHTHSCHHPDTHKVPLDELGENPSALHNTSLKKALRKQMLDGARPPECDYCWRIEDTPGKHPSDRILKSSDSWAEPSFDRVRSQRWDKDTNPSYMEVSFSNICNLKCSYCMPHISSKWMEEIREHGPYPIPSDIRNIEYLKKTDKLPIPESEPNPYVEAFWKWWPELYPSLRVFRITGGEPLLSRNTFRVLDYVRENPRPELELAINSNLCAPDKLIDPFISQIRDITEGRKVKELIVYTSIDTWGKQAEYIRHGLELERFNRNVHRIVEEVPGAKLSFMCTFNALSVTGFLPLLEKVISLRESLASSPLGPYRIFLDTSYLRNPEYLSVKVLTPDYAQKVGEHVRFMEENSRPKRGPTGFDDVEIVKMKRLHAWMLRPEPEYWVSRRRSDFFNFYQEHDRRRGTRFESVFPEMREFWEICRNEARDGYAWSPG